jgi:isopentenyl-diphosphate delta-isomerase
MECRVEIEVSESMDQSRAISGRKADHLRLCASDGVDFQRKSTLLEHVALIHEAMPECHLDAVSLTTELLGKTLKAPIIISGMTGGTPEAEAINRDLARVAEQHGIGFGLGSQRAMLLRPETARTYAVRDVAPNVLLLGNLGLVQARSMETAAVARLAADVGADALCLHLNPAMELVQPGGDRDFREGYATIERLIRELSVPLLIKETGCGISRRTAQRLRDLGVRHIDVGGAGGTSWVGVEALRLESHAAGLAHELWDWGIPTAAAIAASDDLGLEIIATGGLRSGADAAAALSLGARAAGLAAPLLRAHSRAGFEGASAFVGELVASLRAHVFLAGCRAAHELQRCPKVLSPQLDAWIASLRGSGSASLRAGVEPRST